MTYDNNTNPAVKTQETQVNTIELSNGTTVPVPEGADVALFRKMQEAKLQPRQPKRTRARRGLPKKRVNYAEAILWTREGQTEVLV